MSPHERLIRGAMAIACLALAGFTAIGAAALLGARTDVINPADGSTFTCAQLGTDYAGEPPANEQELLALCNEANTPLRWAGAGVIVVALLLLGGFALAIRGIAAPRATSGERVSEPGDRSAPALP